MKDLKIFTENIDNKALEQIDLLLEQEPFKNCKIRIMPDVHAGAGCVIGFTGNLGDKVIPNIVGVDIGCGMLTLDLGDVNLDLQLLDKIIKQFIPSGFKVHNDRKIKFDKLKQLKCYRSLNDTKRFERSIGTLGGGNHFIEVCVDENNNKYLIIHTGSRNLGKQVADYYQNLADKLCNYNYEEYMTKSNELIKIYKSADRKKELKNKLNTLKQNYNKNLNNIPKDLAYLTGKYKEDYLHDMKICQEFASLNREQIASTILNKLNIDHINKFETIHNYICFNDNIVRKGAISAKKDEIVLIPLNMRDGCIIAKGKGNEDWNQSAPHGAGRIMSRNEARRQVDLNEFKKSMHGIYTTSVNKKTIDEAPFVYKPMEEIINNIGDTVNIIKIIKPIYNFKAN